MTRYLLRRALFMIFVLWVVSILTFLIFVKLPPGNPAVRAAGRTQTPETIAAAKHALGLDRPVWVQYARFAKGLVPWPGWFLNKQVYFSFYARILRSSLIDTMHEDFIRTARAKGLSERRVILGHGVRVAITPIVTLFGIDLGYLLGGAIIVENVFNLQGVGQLGIQSLYTNDFPAVMGVTVLASLFIVFANLVVDVLYAFLDPRVRYS